MKTHRFHPTIIREYDIRGVMGETLSAEDAYHLGRAFANRVAQEGKAAPRIALAWDGRLSSPQLRAALSRGMQEAGAIVLSVGLGPTPMLYFAVYHLQADAGIMVTGSHNPPTHNGFKMMLGHASLYGAGIRELADIAARGVADAMGGAEEAHSIQHAYIHRLLQDMPHLANAANARPLSVAWDPGNGATGAVVEAVLESIGGTHYAINTEIDGRFPAHHPDPTVPEYLTQLIALIQQRGCDFGIAFDGDGDRIGVVTQEGRVLWGDELLQIFAREVLAAHPGATVIGDVKASRALFEEIARLGGNALMWKTGHSLIKSKMKETGAKLAGEMSGHMFFADRYYGFDDAIYAALRLVNFLAAPDAPALEALIAAMPRLHSTPEMRIPCPEERKFTVIEEVKARLQQAGTVFNAVDGVRVETPEGWWLLRASNTGGQLIARAEAKDAQALQSLKHAVETQLQQSNVRL